MVGQDAQHAKSGAERSKFDFIILLSLLWTVASALLSEEPRISIAKLQASWCVFLYLARATTMSVCNRARVFTDFFRVGGDLLCFDLVRGRG